MMNDAYVLPVKETIKSAWNQTYGAKKTLWAAFALLLVIAFGFGILTGISNYLSPILSQVINVISQVVIFLLQMGVLYIGIRRAKDMPINFRMLFAAFHSRLALKLIGLYILQFIILIIPAVIAGGCVGIASGAESAGRYLLMLPMGLLAIIAGLATIYLSLRLLMGMGLVLDRGATPWHAVKMSFRATRSNVWPLIGIILAELGILIVSAIPLGIGLIWTLPFVWVVYGTVYKRLSVNIPTTS